MKGWQEENEPTAPNGQKDDLERKDKEKSTGRFLSLLFLFIPVLGFSQWSNCYVVETYSDWTPEYKATALDSIIRSDTGMKWPCPHEWVYANRDDVNGSLLQTTLLNCAPCPCGSTTKEARICRACKFHQTRTLTIGYRNTESEYIQLLQEKERQ